MRQSISSAFSGALLCVLTAMMLSGCGGGGGSTGGSTGGPTPSGDFTVSGVAPAQIAQGDTVNIPVTVTAVGGFNSAVTFGVTGQPAGVTATIAAVTPSASGTTVNLTVATSNSMLANLDTPGGITTPTGTFPIVVTATGGSKTHSANLNLVITGVSISVQPDTQVLTSGNSVTYGITITPVNGFAQSVVLTTQALPSDAVVVFAPATVNMADKQPHTAAMTISLPVGSRSSVKANARIVGYVGGGKFVGIANININPSGSLGGTIQ